MAATAGEVTPDHEHYRSGCRHEVAWPGYYAVELVDYNILAEATAATHVGVTRYRFPYPDCPGSARYSLASPLFDRVEIMLHPEFHKGQKFVIEASRSEPGQVQVEQMQLDGRPHEVPFLTHQQLTAGGTLQLVLSGAR